MTADAASVTVYGIELAGLITEVERIADDRRLGAHVGDPGKGQAPGQLETIHVVPGNTRHLRGNVAAVVGTQTPVGHIFGGIDPGFPGAAVVLQPGIRGCRACQVDCNQAPFLLAQVGCHGLHLAELHGDDHGFLGEARQGLPGRGVRGRIVVAGGAVLVEQPFPEVFQRQLVRVTNSQ